MQGLASGSKINVNDEPTTQEVSVVMERLKTLSYLKEEE